MSERLWDSVRLGGEALAQCGRELFRPGQLCAQVGHALLRGLFEAAHAVEEFFVLFGRRFVAGAEAVGGFQQGRISSGVKPSGFMRRMTIRRATSASV